MAGGCGMMRRIGTAAALLAALAAASCGPRYPAIADLGGDAAFKAFIAQRYGPGTRAARLREELAREGFGLLEDPLGRRYSAILRPDNLPCYSETRIDWTEDRHGRIALIQAARHSCT